MKAVKKFCNIIDCVNEWTGRISAFLVLVTLGVILIEVVLRRFFHMPQIWTMDMICMSFACYIILIAAYGFKQKAFVAVDVLYARLPDACRHMLHIVTYLVFMTPFILMMLPASWSFFYKSFITGEKGYSVWAPPVWPVKLCLFIGLVLLAAQGLSEILKHVIWLVEYWGNGRKLPSDQYMKEGR